MKRGIIALVLLLVPMVVYADSISLSCNKTSVSPGETVTCSVVGNTSSAVSALKAVIKVTGVEMVEAKSNSIWQGDASGGSFDLYTDTNKTGKFNIGTITVKAGSSSGVIGFSEAIFYNADFNEVAVSKNSVTLSIVNTQTPVTPKTETPKTNTTTPVQPKPNQNTTNNTTTKSNNAFLKELSIDGVTIEFDKNVFEYAFEIDNSFDTLMILAVPDDIRSQVIIDGNEKLITGQNNITITIIAENGDRKTYKLVVTKLEDETKSNNANLSSIIIEGHAISFHSNVTSYDIEIDEETKVSIMCKTENEKAVVDIEGNENLKNNSIIKIKVTAENGDSKTYSIHVTKKMNTKTKVVITAICSFITGLLFGLAMVGLAKTIKRRRSL